MTTEEEEKKAEFTQIRLRTGLVENLIKTYFLIFL